MPLIPQQTIVTVSDVMPRKGQTIAGAAALALEEKLRNYPDWRIVSISHSQTALLHPITIVAVVETV